MSTTEGRHESAFGELRDVVVDGAGDIGGAADVGMPDLSVNIAGFKLKNPVLTASGTFGYGVEYSEIVDLNLLGGIVVKATTLRPRLGNPPPRVVETPAGMMSCCGLQNVGVDAFIREKLPLLRSYDTAVIVNVAGESVREFADVVARLEKAEGISAVELNVSCPNVKKGGMAFGVDARSVARITKAVKKVSSRPVIVKLTPNVTDIVSIALAAEEAGADAISLINGILGLAIDVQTRRPRLGNVTGGLSGPALKPIALRMVWQVARAVSIPVIGIGGISSAEDALEFIIAGACAVQVGTANFFKPRVTLEIIDGIREYLKQHGLRSINELRGTFQI